MSFVALYRRYRPTTFEKVIGQDHIVKTLTNQITSNRIGHAYLFTGTRGTGKTSLAKIFSKAINCENPVNGSPCGKCASCIALSDPSNIDVVEIDAASNNGVNEIRELRENVQYPPVSCRYKVYIIDEVHMLTGAAFNALLKTLEEPPKHVVFILATTEAHKIPATILSRCMRFDFKLISTEKIASVISSIYDGEGKKYQPEAVNLIASAGEGSMRDALSIADTALSYGTGELTYDDVVNILGSCNENVLYEFVWAIINGQTGKVLEKINETFALGKSAGVLIKDITSYIRNVLVVKSCANANAMLKLPEDKYNRISSLAELTNESRLLRILTVFAEAENNLKYSNHPRIIFETAAVKCTCPDEDFDINALLGRIKDLENKLEKGVKVITESAPQVENKIVEPIKVEEKPIKEEVKEVKEELKAIFSVSVDEIKGKLLSNLRHHGHEMLWHVMQSVKVEVRGNVLVLLTINEGDDEIIDRVDNRENIEEALSCYLPFELQVKKSDEGKKLDKIDEETERIKKIFGSDIVIIKD